MEKVVYLEKNAVLSDRGVYRYVLTRRWDHQDPTYVLWVMLNPSIADHMKDDHTIRQIVSFSRLWGYGALSVVNLFAYRTTYPRLLKQVADPVGPENNRYIREQAEKAALVVCAWGMHGTLMNRDLAVREILCDTGKDLHLLKRTSGGHPHHPLRIALKTRPAKYSVVV